MTGAGVTSVPLMPVGFPIVARFHSRCKYVRPLFLCLPLSIGSHSCIIRQSYDFVVFSGCLPRSLKSLVLLFSFGKDEALGNRNWCMHSSQCIVS